MLAEFKYGLEPKESFASYLSDQSIPRAAYYYLKKDFFPWVYWNYMVRTLTRSPFSLRSSLTVRSLTGQGPVVRFVRLLQAYVRPVKCTASLRKELYVQLLDIDPYILRRRSLSCAAIR